MTLIEEIDLIRKNIDLRDWILDALKKFETKFGLSTDDFIEKWKSQKIPEPEEHTILEDFLEWEGLVESLKKVEDELRELENRIRES